MFARIACLFWVSLAGSALARDLPRGKAEEPKKAATGCEYLGEGYTKAPGSDTCIRISGSMRMEGAVISGR